jgi:hypothetical protein
MSQAIQEPPNDGRFPPPEAYTRSPTPAAKSPLDLSSLQFVDSSFDVPPYLADFKDATPEINKAVAAVLKDMTFVQKRGHNTYYNYAYATADDLREHVAHLIGAHGLSYEQHEVSIIPVGSMIAVTYLFRLCHESGERGPFERRTALARATSEKGNSADDKSISKANVLALKDWAKSRFSIPTGEDTEPAGGDDPDAGEATPVDRQLQNRANTRNSSPSNGQAAPKGKDGGSAGGSDAMRRLADQLNASLARSKSDKAGTEKGAVDMPHASREDAAWVWAHKYILEELANVNSSEDLSKLVAPQDRQASVLKIKREFPKLYSEILGAFGKPEVMKHTGSLSSVFPEFHGDIINTKNEQGK